MCIKCVVHSIEKCFLDYLSFHKFHFTINHSEIAFATIKRAFFCQQMSLFTCIGHRLISYTFILFFLSWVVILIYSSDEVYSSRTLMHSLVPFYLPSF